MDEYFGKKYQVVRSENFEDLLIFLDIGYIERKVGMTLKPMQWLTRNEDGTYSFHFSCPVLQGEAVFTPRVEFDETKPGGVQVRGYLDIQGNKLIHKQVESSGRTLHYVYEFFPEDMTVTITGDNHPKGNKLDKVVKRYYKLVK